MTVDYSPLGLFYKRKHKSYGDICPGFARMALISKSFIIVPVRKQLMPWLKHMSWFLVTKAWDKFYKPNLKSSSSWSLESSWGTEESRCIKGLEGTGIIKCQKTGHNLPSTHQQLTKSSYFLQAGTQGSQLGTFLSKVQASGESCLTSLCLSHPIYKKKHNHTYFTGMLWKLNVCL